MRYHGILMVFALGFALLVSSLEPVAASGTRISVRDIDAGVLKVFSTGRALEQIDAARASGALTWAEAKALYAEQAVIRSAYIHGRTTHGRKYAAKRAAFMLRVSQGTYARLAFNTVQNRPMDRRVTWAW